MTAVLFRFRANMRARWRSWVGLTLIMGIAGGTVIAAAAGARRTDSAYSRFLKSSRAADAFVYGSPDPSFSHITQEQVASIPEVATTASIVGFTATEPSISPLVAPDGLYGTAVSKQKLLSGRRPVKADEVMVSFLLAEARKLHVGSHLDVHLVPPRPDPSLPPGPAVPFRFRVVGIEAGPGEFPPQTGTGFNVAVLSRAFYAHHAGQLQEFQATAVRLKNQPGVIAAFQRSTDRLGGGRPTSVYLLRDQAANTQRSIHLQAVALWLLAGLLGLTAALILSQLFLRQALLEGRDHVALRSLGMERGQLWIIGMARAACIGVGAAAVALVTALLLSPLTPVGIARLAEPHPGLSIDGLILGMGALATVGMALVAAGLPNWQATRPPATAGSSATARASAVGEALARASAPPPVTAGVRLALDPGRGRTAVPVRSTVIGAAVGIGALAGALVFNGSLAHLLDSPQLYGVAWDARVTTIGPGGVSELAPVVQGDPDVQDLSIGYVGVPMQVRNERVDALVLQPLVGSFQPRVLEGRLPLGPDEIFLGSKTLSRASASVGDRVPVSLVGVPGDASFRVVGRGIMPSTSDAMGLGKGASVSIDAARRLLSATSVAPPNLDNLVVRFAPGVNPEAGRTNLARLVAPFGPVYTVFAPDKPNDVVSFGRVQSLPLVLAALLATLAAATLAHLLVTSIRRRGRELAILKTIGFVPRQVRGAVAWQATTLAIAALALGVPLGVAAGRWAWIVFARQLGIVPAPVVPLLVLLLLLPGTVLVANLVALVPGGLAARVRPAQSLRAE
jgi:hypothetical protein